MHIPSRLFPGDVELGKRNDDHKPGSMSLLAVLWSRHRCMIRKNYKKTALGLVMLCGLYYIFKNMSTNMKHRAAQVDYDHPISSEAKVQKPKVKEDAHSGSRENAASAIVEEKGFGFDPKHWFSGPIKFYELASTLHAISNTKGSRLKNRNVLFAAASPKSAAILLPLACEMANRRRNYVHFAFMGRDDIAMDVLKEINGVKDCELWYHDGRPDYLLESSNYRMEVSATAGLGHINTFMHPQAVIIDNSGREDDYFLKAFREKASTLGRTLIQLPCNAEETLRWITRLNSASLSQWNQVSIDIVIQARPTASGSLLRLLDSLSKADFFRSAPPRLTIEMPNEIDEPTKRFLERYKWPPSDGAVEKNAIHFGLRHRIKQAALTPEENEVRFLESFWPIDPATSHVLILSPQVELSPMFYHYLKYATLEYKYSNTWAAEQHLMGISLDMPFTYLNGSLSFSPPGKMAEDASESDSVAAFLWQAPSSNAVLYFGDKWVELHSLVSHYIATEPKSPSGITSKQISKIYPCWLEDILNLARIRGYDILYPGLANQVGLATVHNELNSPPEEYSGDGDEKLDPQSQVVTEFTADPAHYVSLQHKEQPLAKSSLVHLLPADGALRSLTKMPLLSWDGRLITRVEMEEEATSYAQKFRSEVGGCDSNSTDWARLRMEGRADDLFCFDRSHPLQ